jgi:arylsulfatase A-like enzyme
LLSRISTYELAYKMQESTPEAVDIADESAETLALYGIDQDRTKDFGNKCLLARRLVERGVRFVQIYSGGAHNDDNWDAHSDLKKNHDFHAGNTDKPIAGLIADLKRRGLLDETLIIWGGEFGRQPTAEYAEGTGRDHNSYGFTMWMAGGGIKGGVSVGTTDELGAAAVEKPFHVKNLHATVLHQLGIDPNRLSYFHSGLDQKLVGVEPIEPIQEVIG